MSGWLTGHPQNDQTSGGIIRMDMGNWVVKTLIGLLLASIILPIAIANVLGADQSGWSVSTIALWALIPIAIVIALVIKVFKSAGLGTGEG